MPSHDGFEFCQFPSVIQARGDVFWLQVVEFRRDLFGLLAVGEVTEDEAYWNPSAFEPWLALEDGGIALDVLLPIHRHGIIVPL